MTPTQCLCDTGLNYADCCGPFHAGTTPAPTAVALMRSRYSAFALGDVQYLRDTWHPDTRPATLTLDPTVKWQHLTILNTVAGQFLDTTGEVEFIAYYQGGMQHERSRFIKQHGTWVYLNAI